MRCASNHASRCAQSAASAAALRSALSWRRCASNCVRSKDFWEGSSGRSLSRTMLAVVICFNLRLYKNAIEEMHVCHRLYGWRGHQSCYAGTGGVARQCRSRRHLSGPARCGARRRFCECAEPGCALARYVIASYVDYYRLKPRVRDFTAPVAEIRDFLTRYEGSAIADRLRNDW